MVGYLLCGFVLNFSGVYDDDRLAMIGDLGVTAEAARRLVKRAINTVREHAVTIADTVDAA